MVSKTQQKVFMLLCIRYLQDFVKPPKTQKLLTKTQ